MSKLTFITQSGTGIRDGDQAVMPHDIKRQNPIHFVAILNAFDKLAAYEAIGEPEELVKVVKCKDCEYGSIGSRKHSGVRGIYCDVWKTEMKQNRYCAYGVRRAEVEE